MKGGGEIMTYKEKAQQEHPEINPIDLVYFYCPEDLGYNDPDNCAGLMCTKCWDREMPEEKKS